jgi:hypothetical protein
MKPVRRMSGYRFRENHAAKPSCYGWWYDAWCGFGRIGFRGDDQDNHYAVGQSMVTPRNGIGIFIVSMFIGCLGVGCYLQYEYVYTRPETPKPEVGRIYPLNVHGTVVYLTYEENWQINASWWGGMLSIIIFFIFVGLEKKKGGEKR